MGAAAALLLLPFRGRFERPCALGLLPGSRRLQNESGNVFVWV